MKLTKNIQKTREKILALTWCSSESKNRIEKYYEYMESQHFSPNTQYCYLRVLHSLLKSAKKPLEDITSSDLSSFFRGIRESEVSDGTYNINVKTLRAIYKQMNGGKEHPEIIKDFKPIKPKLVKTKRKIRVMTRDILEKQMSATTCLRDRAFFIFLFESGARVSEALGVNLGDIWQSEDDKDKFYVKLCGKTGPREYPLPLRECVPILKQYLDIHPFRGQEDKPLWIQRGKLTKTRLSRDAVNKMLREVAKASGTEYINPHAFRRGRSTELGNIMTTAQMQKFFGWESPEMANVYIKRSGIDIDTPIDAMNGIRTKKNLTPQQLGGQCPSCGERHVVGAAFCHLCGQSLDKKDIEKKQETEKAVKFFKLYMKFAKKYPELEQGIELVNKREGV